MAPVRPSGEPAVGGGGGFRTAVPVRREHARLCRLQGVASVPRCSGERSSSCATAKGASEGDKSARLALGIRTTLWDRGDPRLDDELIECLDQIPLPVSTGNPSDPGRTRCVGRQGHRRTPPGGRRLSQGLQGTPLERVQLRDRRFTIVAQRHGRSDRSHLRRRGSVGVHSRWDSREAETADGGETLPRPFGQLIVQGRYRDKELVPDKNVRERSSSRATRPLLRASFSVPPTRRQ